MHGLKDQPAILAGYVDDALGPQDVRALLAQQLVQPAGEFAPVQRPVQRQGDAADVVLVGVAARAVGVIVVMPMVVVVVAAMLVVHVAGLAVGRIGELRLHVQDAFQVEPAAAQHLVQRHVGPRRPADRGQRIERPQARLDLGQGGLVHQVGLVDDDLVGEGHLLAGLLRVVQPGHHVLGVDQGGDAVQLGLRLDVLVDEEGLGHRTRIGQAGGLHDDRIERLLARRLSLHQARDHPDQVAAHRAADAAVVHLEHFLVGADHQVVVDADLAELVDDHGVALAVVLGEDPVQQGGLARAEVAGQHGDGDLGLVHGRHLGLRPPG